MSKLQAPEGCQSISFGGETYKTHARGYIEVPSEAVADLVRYHGFTHHVEKPVEDFKVFEKVEKLRSNLRSKAKAATEEGVTPAVDEIDEAAVDEIDEAALEDIIGRKV